jgi:pimeloyl-ACP methyl ester carboxylesterase
VTASPALRSASQARTANGTASTPLRMDRVDTVVPVALPGGRRVSVECWSGEGASVVLLHGLLDCAAGWKHVAKVIDHPCYAVDLPGFGDSDRPTRNRISAYAEAVEGALEALDVHNFTLVGHSLGGGVASELAERLGDEVAALVLIAPVGFGRIRLAETIQLPGVRSLVGHGLPLALQNPVTALGVYMAVVGNGHLPDPEVVARLRKNAYRWAPGARCANEAITAAGRSPRAFHHRQLDYRGPVVALWGDRDRLVPPAHRDGVMTAFPHAQVSIWKKMGHHPQRERPNELARFIEAACGHARARGQGVASGSKPHRAGVRAVRFTPQPLAAGGGELPAVT